MEIPASAAADVDAPMVFEADLSTAIPKEDSLHCTWTVVANVDWLDQSLPLEFLGWKYMYLPQLWLMLMLPCALKIEVSILDLNLVHNIAAQLCDTVSALP